MALLKKLKKFIRELVLKWTDPDLNQMKQYESEIRFDKDRIEVWLKRFCELTGYSLGEVLEEAIGTGPFRLRLPDKVILERNPEIIVVSGTKIYKVNMEDEGYVTITHDHIVTEYRVKYDEAIELSSKKYFLNGKLLIEFDYYMNPGITWYFPNNREIIVEWEYYGVDPFERAIFAMNDSLKNLENYKEGDSLEILRVINEYFTGIGTISVYSESGIRNINGDVDYNELQAEEDQITKYALSNCEGTYEVLERGDGKFTSTARLKTVEVTITTDLLPNEIEEINVGNVIQKLKGIQKSFLGNSFTESQNTVEN